jgi:hypothetical protein
MGSQLHQTMARLKMGRRLFLLQLEPKGQILKLDVLRQYSSGRSISTASASAINTSCHKSGCQMSSNELAGLKTTGLNDRGDDKNADK